MCPKTHIVHTSIVQMICQLSRHCESHINQQLYFSICTTQNSALYHHQHFQHTKPRKTQSTQRHFRLVWPQNCQTWQKHENLHFSTNDYAPINSRLALHSYMVYNLPFEMYVCIAFNIFRYLKWASLHFHNSKLRLK